MTRRLTRNAFVEVVQISELGPFLVPTLLCLIWVLVERLRVRGLLAEGSRYRLLEEQRRLATSYTGLACSLIVPAVALLCLR